MRKRRFRCNTYLKKGMSCLVDGRLSIRNYDDKDGNKRKATEVVVNTMQMLDRAGGGNGSRGDGGGERPRAAAPAGGGGGFQEENFEDEIPV
jgi:single-strand DNA-binding protein